jgi:hypothetical protein
MLQVPRGVEVVARLVFLAAVIGVRTSHRGFRPARRSPPSAGLGRNPGSIVMGYKVHYSMLGLEA